MDVRVTDEDRAAARADVDASARGAVGGAVALIFVALLLSRAVAATVPASAPFLVRFGVEVLLPVGLCLPLLVMVARVVKGRAAVEAAYRMAGERQEQLAADRRDFATRLTNALEMAPTETQALRLAEEALERITGDHPSEVLLADNSRAHLERVAVAPAAGPAGCPVSSPDDCIAARRGHVQVFTDASEIDACPQLKCRSAEVDAAVCVPVSVLGRTVGVVHATTPKAGAGSRIDDQQTAMLQSLANQLGLRLGMIRVMSETSLQASTDSLTGLVNRRRLEAMFTSLYRENTPVAVVLADVDDFKDLNDRHGHDAGDRALRAFAAALRGEVRPSDIVCRYGGEEFVVVLPKCSADDAQRVFQRVQKRVGAIGEDGRLPRFTASYGITESDGSTPLEDLISDADAALYEAKADGKNRLVTRTAFQTVTDLRLDDRLLDRRGDEEPPQARAL